MFIRDGFGDIFISVKKKPAVWRKWVLALVGTGVIGLGGLYGFKSREQEINQVTDGDTVIIEGSAVRLLGVNTPEKGSPGYDEAKNYLGNLIKGKKIWIEQDRTLEDRYDRKMVWLWVNCESTPIFKDDFYMVKTDGSHNPGLLENPEGCKEGQLVNEEIIKAGFGKVYFLSKKGEMKYEERLMLLKEKY